MDSLWGRHLFPSSLVPLCSKIKFQGKKKAGRFHSVSWGGYHQGGARDGLGSVSAKAMGVCY